MNRLEHKSAVALESPRRFPHDSWAEVYDRAYEAIHGWRFKRLGEDALGLIRSAAPEGARILDLGVGTGRLAIPLAREGYRVTAVERSPQMLKVLRRKARGASVTINIRLANIEAFRTRRRHDFSVCVFSVLNYLTTEEQLLGFAECCAAATAVGGRLLLSFAPNLALFVEPLARAGEQTAQVSPEMSISRRPEIWPLIGPLFQYVECIPVVNQGIEKRYRDTFQTRQWAPDEVMDALGQFRLEADYSEMFRYSGECYLLFVRNP